ncbi:MAG: 4-hydroxythreonine-4-phosphate dehydrogenase PdxA [Verrucomicrobiota bacterium]|nr:4-hydroxythreonine-4-phosphate dehydrogenase PdxA [Limisphaera sp.]MDW8382107.1 4-hydroxythreonine-4-phosphate dehydrogenase PdxA [Verrucomicrobiota bacterium]
MQDRPILAITLGDPAGVGPELAVRTLNLPDVHEQCRPVLFASHAVLERLKRQGLGSLSWEQVPLATWDTMLRPDRPLIVDCAVPDGEDWRPGCLAAACGRAAYVYIERAIASALRRAVDGVVTLPIHKGALNQAGVPYPGHTEIFTVLTRAPSTCMMLYSDRLIVSMVTTHIGYAEVPARLSAGRILEVIELTGQACTCLLERAPRLAVCGLNPHAGENGLFGNGEEERFIRPAVEQARHRGWNVEGPLPADTAFVSFQRERFDAWIALYHDQGHIPFKMLAFDTGVNVTLGLPIVRTSVDHGTAFDIAWRGLARNDSLRAAIQVAARLAKNRLHDRGCGR